MMNRLKQKFLIAGFLLVFSGVWVFAAAEAAQKRRPSPEPGKYYDLYLRQGQKQIPMKQGELVFKTALTWGDRKSGLYGLAGPPRLVISDAPLEIFVFDPETAAAQMRLSRLTRQETAPAHVFDLNSTRIEAASFEQVYKVKYNDQVVINLWTADGDIALLISPVPERPGWYRAVPEQKLADGIYAVNFGLVQGPRFYAGEPHFYPFAVGPAPTALPGSPKAAP